MLVSVIFCFSFGLFWGRLKVELVTNPAMREIVDRGILGGITNLSQRICISNSPRHGPYDPSLPDSEILFVDIQGSYANALLNFLPYKGYEFMTAKELSNFNFKNPELDTGEGYIFSVDLKIPEHLRCVHTGPLQAESRKQKTAAENC